MARCKAILEINFDNKRVFDFGRLMFAMWYLAYFLDNIYKAGVMDVQSDDGIVDT